MEKTPQLLESAATCLELLDQLNQLTRSLRACLADAGKSHSLTGTEVQLLYRCASTPDGIAQRELAAALAISPAQVSGLVERLRSRALIVGHRPAEDRRRQVWKLTGRGGEVFQEVMAGVAPGLAAPLAAASPSAVAQLSQLVQQMSAAAQAVAAPCDVRLEPSHQRGAA